MILIISPSKTQDFQCRSFEKHSIPHLIDHSDQLIERLQELNRQELGSLMNISEKLSLLNWQLNRDFSTPFTLDNARQAIFAFKGDVYNGIDSANYIEEQLEFAQRRLRILSGLYGILKPLDLIQPYRLEMGTKIASKRGKNLYEFWGDIVTDQLNKEFEDEQQQVLVNLASQEYYKVVQPKRLQAKALAISFKEKKSDKYKVIAIYAKRARGLMVDYVIKNRITKVEELKNFSSQGYIFREDLSSGTEWVFCRE